MMNRRRIKRPALRWALRVFAFGLCLVVLVVVLGWWRLHTQTKPPSEDIRATMASIERNAYAGVDDDPALMEAFLELWRVRPFDIDASQIDATRVEDGDATSLSADDVAMSRIRRTPRYTFSDESAAHFDAYYRSEAFGEETDAIEALLADPAFRPPDLHDATERMHNVTRTHITAARALAREQKTGAAYAFLDGREDDAVRHVRLMLGLARWTSREPGALALLVGIAIESYTLDAIRAFARHERATEGLLAGLATLLDEHDQLDEGIERTLRGERCLIIDNLTGAYAFEDHRANPITVMFDIASLRDCAEAITEFTERLIVYAETPAHARARMPDAPRAYGSTLPLSYGPAINHFEPLEGVVENATSVRHARACARLLVALRRSTLRHGAPPERLSALVDDGFLDAIPEDTMAPNGRFRYFLDPSAPFGFVLYSVGPDFADNAGIASDVRNERSHVYGVPHGYDMPVEPETGSPERDGGL